MPGWVKDAAVQGYCLSTAQVVTENSEPPTPLHTHTHTHILLPMIDLHWDLFSSRKPVPMDLQLGTLRSSISLSA